MTEEEDKFEEEDFPEEVIEVTEPPPEPPPLKRARNKEDLKQRVECPDCGRQMSLHTLRHTHRCRKSQRQSHQLNQHKQLHL